LLFLFFLAQFFHFLAGDLMRTPLLLIAIVVATALPIYAQVPTIDITASAAPVDMLTLQDVDFINSTSPKWLFTIGLQVRGGGSVTAVMRLFLDVALATGESFPSASRYETQLDPFQGSVSFTNLDLRNQKSHSYSMDATAKRRFEEIALPSGILPAGVYTFRIEVENTQKQIFRASFRFILKNPSRLDLVFPMDNDRTVGQFPLFQWNFDGPRARISIFERLPGQSSPEEAASGIPQVSSEVTGNSFLYPSAGVRPLESGKTYVWCVEGLFGAAGGSNRSFRSPIRSFTVNAGGTNAAIQSLLDELEKAMGPNYKSLFERIRAEGMQPTGQIRLNGSPVTTTELIKLITQLRDNPASVVNADIE
jgi:hypothetical protein